MLRIFEDLQRNERQTLEEMRAWALSQGEVREHLIGKLTIAQRIIDLGNVGPNDVWKLASIGVLFGDTLERAMDGNLRWVMTEDEYGRSFALSWQHSEVLVYPISAIRSRMQEGKAVDVHALFAEYLSLFPHQQL